MPSFRFYLGTDRNTTDVTTLAALKLVAKVVFCEVFQSSRRKYRGTGMFKTVSKPLAHLNFLSGDNCYDIVVGTGPRFCRCSAAQYFLFVF
jgi:hypothetical protein